ncbi:MULTISPECIES: DUF5592 family protein [Enterococcus]|uniref:DUF5592 family protein n=1 Tax=Enterococcus TaxID=1350 RepID=UPI000A186C02|nr:DUF5592 family protein [Enterococcus faecium]MCE3178527.1 DUF5592 family protein [Enterococcus faecium]MCE3184025.1 DUF5592 family protein [Enterococcus faecium]MCU2104482.1 DUF5592 family protein [Enterococcus faecium]MCU2185784.1 DUF5592 family protein [Enterococcus faecium]MCU2188670.1 DUF5592 family protein [Enterococcus faecium]
MHDIQNEIFTETKFWGAILLKDSVAGFLIFNLARNVQDATYGPLQGVSFWFVILMGFFWLCPSVSNAKLRNYQRLFITLTNNRSTYHAIDRMDFEVQERIDMVMGTVEEMEKEDEMLSLEELETERLDNV